MKLSEIAYHKIKSLIMNGEFEQKYTTQIELVKKLSMSRTPIVSALQKLANEGFIKIESKKGIIIEELSIKEINDLFDMRIALETYSIKNLNEDSIIDFRKLEKLIEEQKTYVNNKNFYSFARSDLVFHQEILEANNNPSITKITENIGERLFFHRTLVGKSANLHNFVNDHIKIIEALKQEDQNAASSLTEKHIKSGKIIFG